MKISNGIFEIRGHARGGQGMVTAFEILAKIFSRCYNFEVQAFPFFGVERTGAPIQAFLRISPNKILNRSNIYHPNLIVIFDEGLIEQKNVFDGLTDDGTILINTESFSTTNYQPPTTNCQLFSIPATKISIEKKLGSRMLPIVNAAMIGAILKILDAEIDEAKKIISEEVPAKPEANAEAAEIAFHSVLRITNPELRISKNHTPQTTNHEQINPVPYWDKPMSLNKTGNWRVLTPNYVNRQPPCTANCPAGTDVRLFVKLTSEKKIEDAYEVIYRHNPFPSICGRVCPHFCQQNCNRISFDEQVNIGAIERFLGDKNSSVKFQPSAILHKEKIAVVGSGPAGLTAALRLRQMGYEVTVFESFSKAGGMMRAGIPKFRLPEKILDNEIQKIIQHGVKIILNKKVSVRELEKDFSAVIAAVGSHIGTNMNLPNENESIDGIKFLREIKFNGKEKLIRIGDKVAVIGGGNTAIDVARTVLRLGGKPTIYYRRTRQEMPAIAHEVEEAVKEGVQIEFLTAPVKIAKSKSGKFKIAMVKMKLGEADESGRRKPIPIKNSEKNILADKIIKAIGQRSDDFIFSEEKISVQHGKIRSNGKIPMFCAGDMAWGGTVVEAIGSGNEVAKEVNAFLRRNGFEKDKRSNDTVLPSEMNFAYYLPVAGNPNPFKQVKKIFGDFSEVVQGLPQNKIIEEANRCLHCGDCFNCGNCFNFCPDAAISIDDENRLRIDYDYCKGCGICVRECPCSAMQFEETVSGEQLSVIGEQW